MPQSPKKKKKMNAFDKSTTKDRRNRTTLQKAGPKTVDLSHQGVAKDPDLSSDSKALQSLATLDLEIMLMDSWDVARFEVVASGFAHQGKQVGNDLFQWWTEQSDHIMRWGDVCMGHNSNFRNHPEPCTWDEYGVSFFEQADNKIEALEKEIIRLLDFRMLVEEGTDAADFDWEARQFLVGLSVQCPLTVFGYSDDVNDNFESRYWDKENAFEPTVKMNKNPLAIIWLCAADKLGHPWTHEDSGTSTDVYEALQTIKRKKEEKRRRKKLAKAQDGNGDETMAGADSSDDSDASDTSDDLGQPNSDDSMAEPEDEDVSTVQGSVLSAVAPPIKSVGFFDPTKVTPDKSKKKGTTKGRQKSTENVSRKTTKKGSKEVPASKSTERPTPPGGTTTAPPGPTSYKEALQLPEPFQSDDQKIQKMTQMNMDGLQFSTVSIYNICIGASWAGSDAEINTTIQMKILTAVREQLADAMQKSDDDLTLMAFADNQFKKRKFWISSIADIKAKLPTWKALKQYVDLYYDNGYTFHKFPDDPRDRILRTRMRFAFNTPSDDMRHHLNSAFGEFGGGCYNTPLQFASLMRIGALSHYPAQTNRTKLAKQLMLLFDFKIPIAVDAAWPSSPGQNVERKWNYGGDPKMLHVYTKANFALTVDSTLGSLFHARTKKSDYPWGSPMEYIPDSRLGIKGHLSLEFTESVKTSVARQLDQASAFVHLSEQIICPIKLNGILTPLETTTYEKCSLLKLLWAIKCSPEQAEKAEILEEAEAATTATTADTSGTVSQLSSEWSKETSQKKKNFKGGRRGLSEQEKQEMDLAIKKLLSQDESRSRPSPLFTHILPTELDGKWMFIVRKKYGALARRVLADLPAFLIYHLAEPTVRKEDALFRKWMDMTAVRASRSKGLVWNPAELQATSEVDATTKMQVEDWSDVMGGFDFSDPTEHNFTGQLEIDLEMIAVADMDEGLTIAGILDEARRMKQTQDENAALRAEMVLLKAALEKAKSTPGNVPADSGGGASTARP